MGAGAGRPGPEVVREALSRWRKGRWFIPESFCSEAELGDLEPLYRITAEAVAEERRWAETNGETPPPAGDVELPAFPAGGRTTFRVPGSERRRPCAPCAGTGERPCPSCSGLGRVQCADCRGRGCPTCGRRGTSGCAACGTGGKARCGACSGSGGDVRANVLEVTRAGFRATRLLGPAHPDLGPSAPEVLLDVVVGAGTDVSRSLRELPAPVGTAALDLLGELDQKAGGRRAERRLRVEQLPVWSGSWTFGRRSGRVWFHGTPPSVTLPYPPRSVFVLATFLWLALMAPPAVFLLYLAFRPEPPREPEPPRTASRPPEPAPTAPRAPARLPEPPPRPAGLLDDAILVLAQGGMKRGRLLPSPAEFRVETAEGESRLQPWEVEEVLADAGEAIRAKLRAVAGLEEAAKELLLRGAPREEAVRALLRVHRERDAWVALAPLCRAGELPEGPPPRDRLDDLIAHLSRILEPPAVAKPAAAEPAPPAPAGPAGPSREEIAALLSESAKPVAPGRRDELCSRLRAAAPALPEKGDLLLAASLYVSRPPREWGLEADELEIEAGQLRLRHAGVLEAEQARYLVLKLPQGERVVAFREAVEDWIVNLPGGSRVDDARCTARRQVPTRPGEVLQTHFGRFAPGGWVALAPAAHLEAARELAGAAGSFAAHEERGEGLVRRFAAAHAAAALLAGTAGGIAESRETLRKLGLAEAAGGRWHRPEDLNAVRGGALIRAGRVAEALPALSGLGDLRGFPSRYRSLAARVCCPVSTPDELRELQASLRSVAGLARSETEHRHAAALQDALAGFKVCGRCGGDATSSCTACRGQGKRRVTCGNCKGHGVLVRAGQGGGILQCPACRGRPELPAQACSKCGGLGRISCATCAGPFRLPRPDDLCRLSLCTSCEGQGGFGTTVFLACPACLALGLRLVPAGAPDDLLR